MQSYKLSIDNNALGWKKYQDIAGTRRERDTPDTLTDQAMKNPGALAGATGVSQGGANETSELSEYHDHPNAATFLVRRYGLTGATAKTVAALIWGAV
ncbi:hypothetical protein ACFQ3C_01495 [Seohaeicola saemankumensis]|uniref:Uncharacterized protein n=1 Tax=Seohaeicola saemankumensis TaxID=481181 RepID=A0ABW3T8H9_9RHOB